uniref:F-box domain-containing protein n=1 Tax=Oryza barthii TaxID=65489 RepID=A0A0D3GKQ9_9ORYZ
MMAAAMRPYCKPPPPTTTTTAITSSSGQNHKRLRHSLPAAAAMDGGMEEEAVVPPPPTTMTTTTPPQPLLPGLPDHLAQLCLSPLPPRLLHAVCRPWRRLMYTPSFPPFLSLYALLDDADADAGTIYVVDEERGALTAYDWGADRWRTVAESDRLKGAAEMTVAGGKACVVAPGGGKVLIVDVTPPPPPPPAARRESWAASPPPPRMWEVAAPGGKRVVSLHVLPRMTRPE